MSLRKDVHNEYTDSTRVGKDIRKKCNKCATEMCRNASTLARHANKCHGYTKYTLSGDLIKCKDNDSCNWKSQHSPAPAMTNDECIISEMNLMDQQECPRTPVSKTPYFKKKLAFNSLSAKYKQEQQDMYSTKGIASYFNKPQPPRSKPEIEYANKCWTEFFAVGKVHFKLMEHPLFAKACHSLRTSYNPITAKTATTNYVKKLKEENDEELKQCMNNSKIWVQCDGSENGQKQGVVHLIASGKFGTRLIGIKYHKRGQKVSADVLISELILGSAVWTQAKEILISFRAITGAFKHSAFTNITPNDTKWKSMQAWSFYKSLVPTPEINKHKLLDEVIFLMESKTGITDTERTFCPYRRIHNWEAANMGQRLLSDLVSIGTNYNFRNRI